MKRSYKGFTLIELLVVIAIIGLLSTLAVVALNSARQRSRDAKRVADIRQIQTALELGFSEVSGYPSAATGCGAAGAETCASVILGSATATVLCRNTATPPIATWQSNTAGCAGATIYMGLVPTNPLPAGTDYRYIGAANSYQILFNLEGATGQLGAGNNCANQNGITAGTGC